MSPHSCSTPALDSSTDSSTPALDSSTRARDRSALDRSAQNRRDPSGARAAGPDPVRSTARGPFLRRGGLLAVAAGSILWGTTGVLVRSVHASTGLSPSGIGCYRLAIAALVLVAVRPAPVVRGLRTALRRPGLLLASGAGLGLYQALYFLGVQEAGVSVATLVSIGVAPVVTTVGAALARRRMPSGASAAVLAVALVGLLLVCLPGLGSGIGPGGAQGRTTVGVLASLGSGTGYGITVLLNRRLAGAVDALTMTVATSAVGALVLIGPAVASGPVLVRDPAALGSLIYLGVVCTAVAYGLFYAGLRSTAGEVAVVVTLLEPLTATALSVALLGEPLTWPTVVGGMLMLAAIVVLSLRPAR